MNKKMWSLLVHLSGNMWVDGRDWKFDEEVWDEIIAESCKSGINTIILDLGNGIQYGSHPELADPGAWSRQRVKNEVKRLKELGIELIPKLNFSAVHDAWLKEYGRMVSTPIYYTVCRDLITEVYNLFDKPEYIHLGMDEEHAECCGGISLAVYRQGDLIWHDLQFLCDCVRDMGATPWIWADYCMNHPEKFRQNVKTDDIVLSPWMYSAVKEENFTLIEKDPILVEYYTTRTPYKYMNLKYVEEDFQHAAFREQAIPAAKDGYKSAPCVSLVERYENNPREVMEYFKNEAPDENVLGFMLAPWVATDKENKDEIMRSIRVFKDAKDEIYGK